MTNGYSLEIVKNKNYRTRDRYYETIMNINVHHFHISPMPLMPCIWTCVPTGGSLVCVKRCTNPSTPGPVCAYRIEAEKRWPPFCRRHLQMHFLCENFWISNKISFHIILLTMVQIMTWHRIDDKPLSELMIAQFTDAYMRHLASMS